MVKTYSNCTIVLENLEITYMEDHRDLSFLRSIKEVGGYVLIALNTVSRIPLENLRIIRGHSLYDGSFALSVFSNYNNSTNKGTDQILLTSLTEILKGGVNFFNNQLCNVETIQWSDIVNVGNISIDPTPSKNKNCGKCDSSCFNGSCWAPGPQNCQTLTKLNCAQQCSRRCKGPSPSDCCNEHCAAGCTGPRAEDCLACRDFQDNGVCKDSNLYQLVPNPHGKYSFGATFVKSCPLCNGLGTGELAHVLSINATNIGSFENCTIINGNIDIIITSIYLDQFTKTPKMDPEQLNVFKTVKEITGYLWIQTWPDTMSSLSPFENLEVVQGRTKRGSRSLVVSGLHITHLGLRSLREISDGDVFVSKNSELCYTDAKHWQKLFKSPHQTVNIEGNANAATCALRNDTCDRKCTVDGCWSPGPSMCISCRDYKHDGSCVDSCNILEGEPRETAMNKTCIKCHPECQPMNGTATCSAPGSANCTKCANFKDGLFCVSRARSVH
ncbi:epidermal growth factor receptor [Oreochromis niloticus]|uniref:epidermal growth factor receptor n=1 Tax=Oreochromis niloticus TaxID=8128 RepID=UPI000DF3928F|nr:epidermal growth factor receptor [Oreochromis niloticus]